MGPSAGGPQAAPGGAAVSANGPAPLTSLWKGMTSGQVKAVLGEPESVAPAKPGSAWTEVWTYHHTYNGPVREVVLTTHVQPRMNPISGVMESEDVPDYTQEMTYYHETIELRMRDGTLLEWKQNVREERVRNR